jgi:hypothetical protein
MELKKERSVRFGKQICKFALAALEEQTQSTMWRQHKPKLKKQAQQLLNMQFAPRSATMKLMVLNSPNH